MIPSYGFDRENEKKLIEDVRVPAANKPGLGFDVRLPKVRRHSIGYLDNEYTKRLRAFVKPADENNDADAIDKARQQRYTRVPPLTTVGAPAFAAATAAKARQSLLHWLPTKYTLRKGLRLNLQTEVFPLVKFILPILAVVIGLLIALSGGSKPQPIHKAAHNQQISSPSNSSQPTAPANSPATPSTAPTTGPSTGSSFSSTSTGNSPTYGAFGGGSFSSGSSTSQPAPVGGMGGGSTSPTGGSSGSGSSGSFLPTVSTQPTCVDLGGKCLVNVGSTTLN